MSGDDYSSIQEVKRIVELLLRLVSLPPEVRAFAQRNVSITASRDFPYFPIPFKETELGAALKAIEGSVAAALADLQHGAPTNRQITVNLEKTTAFLFQAYLATVGNHGKLDDGVKDFLKGKTNLSMAKLDFVQRKANAFFSRYRPPPSTVRRIPAHGGESL